MSLRKSPFIANKSSCENFPALTVQSKTCVKPSFGRNVSRGTLKFQVEAKYGQSRNTAVTRWACTRNTQHVRALSSLSSIFPFMIHPFSHTCTLHFAHVTLWSMLRNIIEFIITVKSNFVKLKNVTLSYQNSSQIQFFTYFF